MEDSSSEKTYNFKESHNLMSVRGFEYGNKMYGLVHIKLKYFTKKPNYDNYMLAITETAETAFQISKKNNNANKIFVFLDFTDITSKNFSRKFIKRVSKKLNTDYKDTLELCFLRGNIGFIKMIWPLVKLFVDSDTREKLVLLK